MPLPAGTAASDAVLADPLGAIEGKAGFGERGDHQPVPIGEDLVIEPGPDSRRARLQEQCTALRQLGLGVLIGKLGLV